MPDAPMIADDQLRGIFLFPIADQKSREITILTQTALFQITLADKKADPILARIMEPDGDLIVANGLLEQVKKPVPFDLTELKQIVRYPDDKNFVVDVTAENPETMKRSSKTVRFKSVEDEDRFVTTITDTPGRAFDAEMQKLNPIYAAMGPIVVTLIVGAIWGFTFATAINPPDKPFRGKGRLIYDAAMLLGPMGVAILGGIVGTLLFAWAVYAVMVRKDKQILTARRIAG